VGGMISFCRKKNTLEIPMQSTKLILDEELKFPPFHLSTLIKTVFAPKKNEKICILIDLDNPEDVKDFSFLKMDGYSEQKYAHDIFYEGLKKNNEFGFANVDLYAYAITGGSNLELPESVFDFSGEKHDLVKNIYQKYDIILCIGAHSATAPLAAAAKEYGFRGATMHGINEIIINSGLAVDQLEVSKTAEKMRLGLTGADSADIEFEVAGNKYHLHVYLGDQIAQKNHGICHKKREVVNLPAGEVYFVPYDAEGSFPMKFEDGTMALMIVSKGRVKKTTLISGDQNTVDEFQKKISNDKAAGIIGELGFGTQKLPFSSSEIQDEKILGTLHIATGRNDHLHGSINLDRFIDKKNATHDDILFSKTKTPEIKVTKVMLKRNGKSELLIANYEPQQYLLNLIS
jgi:hypothetical protein